MGDAAANRRTIDGFWEKLYTKDWDALGALFAPDGEYTDVPTPEDDVARGPEEIIARLRLGLDPVEEMRHHPKSVVADGNLVMTEHAEEWRWHTGEVVVLPFVSVHEFDDDGRILRWWDYWDLTTLLGSAPQWWLDHIMSGGEPA